MPDRARDAKAALTWAYKIVGLTAATFPPSNLPPGLFLPSTTQNRRHGELAQFGRAVCLPRRANRLPGDILFPIPKAQSAYAPLPRTPAPAASISGRNETVVANVAYKLQKRRYLSNHGFLRISNETSTSPSFISSHPKITTTKKRSRPRSRTRF